MRRRDAIRAGLLATSLSAFGTAGAAATDERAGVVGAADGRSGGSAASTATFAPRGRLRVPGTKEAVVSPDGQTAYLAVTDGFATVDVSEPARPQLLAERRELLADEGPGPLRQVYDVKLSGETLAVVGPANGGGATARRGVYLADVSDPADPAFAGFHPTTFPIHNCAFVDGTLYLTGNGAETVDGTTRNPLVIVDTTGDEPREVARWSLVAHDERWADVRPFFRTLHDVWVRDGLAALAHWDAGTYLLDVSDPSDPTHRGTIPAVSPETLRDPERGEYTTTPGNHHYVATDETNALLGVGVEAWAVETDDGTRGGPGGITLYDVSDPTAPQELATVDPPRARDETFRGPWTTSHNFEFRERTLYSSWYGGGVKRHDVSDPAAPVERSWWVDPAAARFWTARVAVPGESFVAANMGVAGRGVADDAGLWVFPTTDGTGGDPAALTATPTETATQTQTASDEGTTTAPPTGTPTPASTPTAGSPATTAAPGSTDGSAGDGGATGDGAAERDTETTTEGPGFGLPTALAGLGLGGLGLGAWRRRRTGGGGDEEEPDDER